MEVQVLSTAEKQAVPKGQPVFIYGEGLNRVSAERLRGRAAMDGGGSERGGLEGAG
ncbi:MAG: hypothetical protein JW904_13550 [Spirochaetales bacterium]|nr:hypothetical protein [Spirochaetales bacterium]